MNKEVNKTLFAITVSLLLVLSVLLQINIYAGGEATQKKAKWTFIVYLDSDNDLEEAGIHDINEMETVGSTDDVNIIVLIDRAIGYDTTNGDWTDARVYRITKDDDAQTINSPVIEYKGELNMGDPKTLINFTNWAIDKYPADKYILDVWDHGGAFSGVAWDDGDPNTAADDDKLDLDNVSFALDSIKNHLGRNLDVFGFDACLMGAASVMYSLYGYIDIAIAAGPSEPGDGWPYEKLLPPLVEKPSMTPAELAKDIVTTYVESYNDFKGDPNDSLKQVMSAWYMDKMLPVFSSINALGMAMAMDSGMPPDGKIGRLYAIRDKTHSYDGYAIAGIDFEAYYTMYDVYDLAGQILRDRTLRDDKLTACAEEIRRAIEEANVVSSAGIVAGLSDVYGLTIYWPIGERASPDQKWGPASAYSPKYDYTQWAKEQFWSEFLKSYWIPHVSATNTPPAIYFNGGNCIRLNTTCDCGVEISGIAYSLSGSVKVYISIDNQSWQETQTEQKGNNVMWKYSLNTLKQKYGNHTVKLKAVDSSSKESPVISRQITVTAPPIPEAPAQINILPAIVLLLASVLIVISLFVYAKKKRRKK
ncbi:MAG: clostripain-related cysteine peptidase [Thermoplasmata archaeon]